jgi:TM2 domain-containing membrane protein YozV
MGIGTFLLLLFIAFIIYVYFYLKQKYGDISSAFKSIGDSLNPVNTVGDQVNSAGNKIKNLF